MFNLIHMQKEKKIFILTFIFKKQRVASEQEIKASFSSPQKYN